MKRGSHSQMKNNNKSSNPSESLFKGSEKPMQQTSKMQSNQTQKVIEDQHYSNNIMMNVFSTLESLKEVARGSKPVRENKLYGYYDKVNYDGKNFAELKSQLQTQLMLLKASRQAFKYENPTANHRLPHSFNQDKVKQELRNFKAAFKGNSDIVEMCEDFEKINTGNFDSKMNFETKNHAVYYSKEEESNHRRQLLKRGINAAGFRDQQKQKIDKMGVKNQYDLPVQINRFNYPNSSNYEPKRPC